nr:protein kinase-like domain, phloem protein 2-like protein [Tanacetum cinerariifolium]
CPHTPVIGPKLDENTYNTVNRPNELDNIPQQRSDGWMEVKEQVKWNSVIMRLIDDLLALDSIMRFGFSDQRLEQTATFSISTNSDKIKLCLITLDAELQVSHMLSDNNVPDLQVDCVIFEVSFRDLVLVVVSSAYNNLFQKGIPISFKSLDTYDTNNPHVRSDCTTIRWGIVSSDVEILTLKPLMSNIVGCSNNHLMNDPISLCLLRSLLSSGSWYDWLKHRPSCSQAQARLRLAIQNEERAATWRSWKELVSCQTFSKLRTVELEAILILKSQNHVFSSCLDLNLVEMDKGLDCDDISHETFNTESVVLYCCGGGGSRRVVVVVSVVAVVKDFGRGEVFGFG